MALRFKSGVPLGLSPTVDVIALTALGLLVGESIIFEAEFLETKKLEGFRQFNASGFGSILEEFT
jgi:hypothetical protein